ncbi:hypothetical protein ACWIGY_22220 [Streptomyces anulatus]
MVIGDHGSVTYYAAALGTPVLLGTAPLDSLDPDAPVADFIRTAPGRLVGVLLGQDPDRLVGQRQHGGLLGGQQDLGQVRENPCGVVRLVEAVVRVG